MNSETAYEIDGLFIRANGRNSVGSQAEVEFRDGSSSPAQGQVRFGFGWLHSNDYFFQECLQQLFSIAVGGCGSFPYVPEISAQCSDPRPLLVGYGARVLALPSREFDLGGLKFTEPRLPFGF